MPVFVRHVVSKVYNTITAEEYVNAYKYPDSISRGAHPIDIHVAAGAEQSVTFLKKAAYVPYRALIAEDFPESARSGRCISADKTSFASLRVQASCMGGRTSRRSGSRTMYKGRCDRTKG